MENFLSLLGDPFFAAGLVIFLAGACVFIWCLAQLRTAPAGHRRMPAPPAAYAPPMEALRPMAPAPVAAGGNDTAVMYGVIEERFSEMSRRLASIEKGGGGNGDGAGLSPVLKRLEEMEAELAKIKLFIADAPPAANGAGPDVSALTEKVATLQKMMESFTLEPETQKPS